MTTYRVGVAYRGTTTYDIEAPNEQAAYDFVRDFVFRRDSVVPTFQEVTSIEEKP